MSSSISAPAVASSSSSSSSSSDSESDHEHSEENSTHSAELHSQGINDHRKEEERLTEAEKNMRIQKQLKVSSGFQEIAQIQKVYHSLNPCKILLIFLGFATSRKKKLNMYLCAMRKVVRLFMVIKNLILITTLSYRDQKFQRTHKS